jgi:NAD(P)H-dependent flavin oxidoreductase YrpB (nitropropane dioxygenase family)
MGGGLARHELAAAVSGAGGLGTIGILDPEPLRQEIAKARERLEGRPIAVNLLLPFARRPHFDVASEADVVVTFWGTPERRTSKPWIHQCGSTEEARAAHQAGADAVIAQGVEAGGHVRGTIPALELLASIRATLPDGYPVLSAGGIADGADVKTCLEAGAEAVVCGTRFLMSEESGAHPEYKARLVEARETILTEMFGFGWPAPHRVVPNRATDRWLSGDQRGPAWLRAINRVARPIVATGPASSQFRLVGRLAAMQRPRVPLFSPAGAVADGSRNLIEAGPLYAGESVMRIADIRPAATIVRDLVAGTAKAV